MTNPTIVSPLRQRMIEDTARGLGQQTQRGHIRACKRFAADLKRSMADSVPVIADSGSAPHRDRVLQRILASCPVPHNAHRPLDCRVVRNALRPQVDVAAMSKNALS